LKNFYPCHAKEKTQMNIKDSDLQAIYSVLQLLFNASSADEANNIVMQHPLLLDKKTNMVLTKMIKSAQKDGNEEAVDLFSFHRDALQSCRKK